MAETKPARSAQRRRRPAAEIKDRLLQAAREEFARRGFTGATTAAIARRADVTEAQLFRYYASKVELFGEAIFKPLDRHLSDFMGRDATGPGGTGGTDASDAEIYIGELRRFIERHAGMLGSLVVAEMHANGATPGMRKIESLNSYFEHGAANMRLVEPVRVPPPLMVRMAFAAVLACVLFRDWVFPEGLASDEEIEAAISDFVIDGLNANRDPAIRRTAARSRRAPPAAAPGAAHDGGI